MFENLLILNYTMKIMCGMNESRPLEYMRITDEGARPVVTAHLSIME